MSPIISSHLHQILHLRILKNRTCNSKEAVFPLARTESRVPPFFLHALANSGNMECWSNSIGKVEYGGAKPSFKNMSPPALSLQDSAFFPAHVLPACGGTKTNWKLFAPSLIQCCQNPSFLSNNFVGFIRGPPQCRNNQRQQQ